MPAQRAGEAAAGVTPRSLLFVPGDSTRKMEKGAGSGADALILDLEDSVAEPNKAEARKLVRAALDARPARAGQALWVRINPLSSPSARADLAAVLPGAPDGIMLPKTDSGQDVAVLAHYLDALEEAFGLPAGRIQILPVATETAKALFTLGTYVGVTPRLAGITWGAEDIAAALGASTNRGADGQLAFTYQLARSLCLAGAAAAEAPAVETVFTNFRDGAGLETFATSARRDGFTGMLAIHPDQVAPINAAFTPTAEEVARAEQVVALFDENPSLGAASLDGQMLDLPHLKQARRVLTVARG